jgi:hypothetical protein
MKAQTEVHDKTGKNQHNPSGTNEQKGAQQEGASWQLYFVMAVIGLGILGLVGKAVGIF